MLIYSEVRYVPTDINMMVLRGADDKYYYIHRLLYDQAVILSDIYGENVSELVKLLSGSDTIPDSVKEFMETVPAPINILGAFLVLVKGELTSFKDMVGAIHVMSGPINLRQMVKYPYYVRSNISFSLSITEEYSLAWDRFFLTAIEYTEDLYVPKTFVPNNGTVTAMNNGRDDASAKSVEDMNEDELEDALYDALFNVPTDLFASSNDSEEESTETEVPVSAPDPVITPPPAPVDDDGNNSVTSVKSGLSILESL